MPGFLCNLVQFAGLVRLAGRFARKFRRDAVEHHQGEAVVQGGPKRFHQWPVFVARVAGELDSQPRLRQLAGAEGP